jgi:hypothetical protein
MTISLGIPGLLFADDFPTASFRNYGIQKKFELVDQYIKNRNLKCNLRKSKLMVFKKGGKLKASGGWRMSGQNSGVVDNFN